ncbi:MAG: hypothetical protein K0S47_2519 [Herbinix sp.]|jgi:predicted phosphate transport protein (TIGR00153 family)|nr:hypothetical protein [Herbinix sp.]
MGKKNDFNYFSAFINLSKHSLNLAEILNKTLHEFDPKYVTEKRKEMHQIEHNADLAKHEVMNRLVKEFLPPIEREDITDLCQNIDEVTDAIEDVIIYIDMFNIQSIRPEILKFTELIVECCKTMHTAVEEFANFKGSKTLHSKIIEVNRMEEEGDALYVDAVRKLYQTSKDPIELMTWTEILHRLEKCCDECEDVADSIESIVMKNS